MLHFSVKDTGVGIKEEERAKLFTLFGKLESSSQLNTNGIGLGLNICKKIIEACGGSIYLEQSYNDGSCFCFTIKAYQNEYDFKQAQLIIALQESGNTRINTETIFLYGEARENIVNFNSFLVSFEDGDRQEGDIGTYSVVHQFSARNRLLTDLGEFYEGLCACRARPQVLIVDDNIFNIITLETILDMQFKVKADKATNGA